MASTTKDLRFNTNRSYESMILLKSFAIGIGVACCFPTVSTTYGSKGIYAHHARTEPTSVITTYSSNCYMLSRGNISLFSENILPVNNDVLFNFSKLDEIALLPDNWNNNGASSFSERIIERMRFIVSQLKIQPSIFPTARNSIQFEYENTKGDYLEFELFENGDLKKFCYTSTGSSTTEYITDESIEGIVSAFFE